VVISQPLSGFFQIKFIANIPKSERVDSMPRINSMQAVYRERIESRKSLTLIDEADELKSQSERGRNLVRKNKNSCYSFSSNEPLQVQI